MPRNESVPSAQTESKATKAPKATKATNEDEEISYEIISTDVWNPDNHKCGNGKPNKNGQGKSAAFTYGVKKFYLKVPKMHCPFGASKPKPKPGKENEVPQWSLQMSFGDDNSGKSFQSKAVQFDQNMIDEGSKPERTVDWLGAPKAKPYGREVVESKYTPMVKYSKTADGEINTQYPAFIRPQFPTSFKNKNEFTCEIYNQKNDLMTVSTNPTDENFIAKLVPNNCQCSALLQGSIWCNTTTGYGITWRIMQLKVFPSKAALPKGKCLVDEPEDDEENEGDEEAETVKVPVKTVTQPITQTTATVDVDETIDVQEEDGEEVETEALVQSTVVKPVPVVVEAPKAVKKLAPVKKA